MPRKLDKRESCLNCGNRIGDANYCPQCGQINHTKQLPLRQFIRDLLGDYFTFDSKFLRSFIPLLGRPGFLTNEYNSGRRVSYILPLRLYLFTTIFFFFLVSLHGKLSRSDERTLTNQIANKDSLRAVLAQYEQIPSYLQELLIDDIYGNYQLTPRSSRQSVAYKDSIKLLIARDYPEIDADHRNRLLSDLFKNFKFARKKRDNDDVLQENLRDIVFQHLVQNDSRLSARLYQDIESQFSLRNASVRETQREASDGVMYSWTNPDSVDSGLERWFAKKIEDMMRREEGDRLFWREVVNQIPKVMFLVLPLFALLLKLVYVRQKILYINHLIFSLHAHTIFFLYLLLPILFPVWYVIVFTIVGCWFHLFFAMRNVYRQSRFMTFLKLNSVLVLYQVPLLLGFVLLSILAVVNV